MPPSPRRAGRPRQPVSREAVLDAARCAFARGGYSGTSMAEIAERVGIRKSSLFHHAGSKEALYLEAVGGVLARLGSMVLDASRGPGTFVERLDGLGDAVVSYLAGSPQAAGLLLREMLDNGPFVGGEAREVVASVLAEIAAFLQGGVDDGSIPAQNPEQLALSIVGLHLFYFASPDLSAMLIGDSVWDPARLEQRRAAIKVQLRGLCGVS